MASHSLARSRRLSMIASPAFSRLAKARVRSTPPASGETITTTPLAMSDIAYINPPPHVSGEGVSTSGRLNLGLTANRGNTDNDQMFYDAEAVARSLKNRFTIGATGETRNEEGEETARRNRGYFKYDHFLTPKWYAYANTDVQEDKFKDLNLRWRNASIRRDYSAHEFDENRIFISYPLSLL